MFDVAIVIQILVTFGSGVTTMSCFAILVCVNVVIPILTFNPRSGILVPKKSPKRGMWPSKDGGFSLLWVVEMTYDIFTPQNTVF